MLLDFEGVKVEFPYEPYACQRIYIEHVLKALKQGRNAVLESPTGTGKTLSLLCSSLAFVRLQKENFKLNAGIVQAQLQGGEQNLLMPRFPQVIYASRTHSQLKQVVRELNKTNYKASIQVSFLAGREQLCLDKRVQAEENTNAKSQICRTLTKSRSCMYYNGLSKENLLELREKYSNENGGNVMDIEDLVQAGRKLKHCPFFRMKHIQSSADLILLPYNYVLDSKIRTISDLKLKGNILILDEAHNISNIAEESVSVSISSLLIAACIRELQTVLEAVIEEEEKIRAEAESGARPYHTRQQAEDEDDEEKEALLRKEDVAQLLDMLQKLDTHLAEFSKNLPVGSKPIQTLPGHVYSADILLNLLNTVGIRSDNSQAIGSLVDRIGLFWLKHETESGQGGGVFSQKIVKLSDFSLFVSRVFMSGAQGEEDIHDLFRVYITDTEKEGLVVNYWCFSAAVAMRQLYSEEPLSIILTSGTLSPIDNFIASMGIPFLYKLENQHAVNPNEIILRSIRYGYGAVANRVELMGTYQNRDSPLYIRAVGDIVVGAVKDVPQGILVFFTSYPQMAKFLTTWKKANGGASGGSLFNKIQEHKKVCVEPSNRNEIPSVFREFDMQIRFGGGAIMFAVCRGKMSEGIDFADCHARAVIIVGIPYPPLMDPRIILKKQFLSDRLSQNKGDLAPGEWYQIEAIRAVNQALGRVIRHKDDFGVVILTDARFEQLPLKSYPAWVRSSIRNEINPNSLFAGIRRFFSERSLMVEKSQKENSMTINCKQQTVMISEDTRTREQMQAEDMKRIFELYSGGDFSPTISPSYTPKPMPRPGALSAQKRKLVLKQSNSADRSTPESGNKRQNIG